MIKHFGLSYLVLISSVGALAQLPETKSPDAYKSNITRTYNEYINVEAPLFSGPVYNDYRHTISNSLPFIKTAELQPGSIKYDGILYEKVLLNYDVFKEELLVQNPANQKIFKALKSKLSYFEFSGTRFIMMHNSIGVIRPGFYEVLYAGTKIEVLLKHSKDLDENISGYTTQFSFTNYSKFYLRKGGQYFKVDTHRSLLKVFDDKQAEIRKLMQEKNLSMKSDSKALLIQVAAYYDQL